MNKILCSKGLLLTILLSGLLLSIRYHELLENLNEPKAMDVDRDGIKTYTNAIFHARYDTNMTDFGGMNYPYKEHIVAATELPGLAILLQWLTPIFPNLPNYVFGITHLLLIFCMLLSAILMYLLFKELSLPDWYSMVVAIGLMFLSPQNLRFGPHLGLAPLFVIPAVLYGLIILEKNQKYITSIFLALTICVASLFHFYFFAICTMTVGLYFCFGIFYNFNWQWLWNRLPHYALIMGLPTVLMYLWLVVNDPIDDRCAAPYGFLVYHSKWEGIFLNPNIPYWRFIDENFIKFESVDFEGWAYVGLIAGLFTLLTLVKFIFLKFKNPLLPYIGNVNRPYLYPMIGMAVVIGLYSCSQPFATKGLEFLLNYFGPLRQFRSTGRFAWVLFYVLNILAYASIYNLVLSLKNKLLKYVGLILSLSILIYEAGHLTYREYVFKPLQTVPELVNGNKFTDISSLDFKKYQAILPLPYFNVGSSNLEVPGSGNILQLAVIMSEQTGLPLTGAMLTRSSRTQTYKQVQLVGSPYRFTSILNDYPNKKPLIALASKTLSVEDSLRYMPLVKGLPLLYETERYKLFELDLTTFQRRITEREAEILNEFGHSQLFEIQDFMSTDSTLNFIYESFDDLKSQIQYEGAGAYETDYMPQKLFYECKVPNSRLDDYELLLWVYINEDRFSNINIKLTELGPNNNILQEKVTRVKNEAIEFDSNGWVLIQNTFRLMSQNSRLSLTILADDVAEKNMCIDELLIKPLRTNIYQINGDKLWWNNRKFH